MPHMEKYLGNQNNIINVKYKLQAIRKTDPEILLEHYVFLRNHNHFSH